MHSNISIFVPHVGCPHKCAFCDQNAITGRQDIPRGEDVERACAQALGRVDDPADTEIAFFGGSFTAIPRSYMLELLSAAQGYVGEGKFAGIRISTRPDCIDEEVLDILKSRGVTAIELGAQSMSDKVLAANERGHSAEDVRRASRLIREFGFELGLQMMVGLYRSDEEDEELTVNSILELAPDTARIYPVVILENTRLAELYRGGEYKPFSFDRAVELSADALLRFHRAGIRVIKCGLHASEVVERDMAGGFYHPAFRELCEGLIYRRAMEKELAAAKERGALSDDGRVTFAADPSCISKAVGQKRANKEYFRKMGIDIKLVGDRSVPVYEVRAVF